MKGSTYAPVALIVDDEPLHAKALETMLRALGITAVTVATAREFVEKLREMRPELCLIDLNVEARGIGFRVIEAVRKTRGAGPALIVTSGTDDPIAITRAVELGASDYLVKPLDPDVLARVLSRYVTTEQLGRTRHELLPLTDGGCFATVRFGLQVQEVDELGMVLVGPHLLSKGGSVLFEGHIMEQLTGRSEPQELSVTSTWIVPGESSYGAVAKFDAEDRPLLASVRRWLARNTPSLR